MATETGALGQSSIRDVLNVAADKTQRYVREVVERRVSPSKEAVEARHALLARAGWDVTADGMFGAPLMEVVVGAEVHASMLKALSLAGFGRKRLKIVDSDGQGRMRADKLPRLSERTIVCIQAGNVNTGAFDPAGEICRVA